MLSQRKTLADLTAWTKRSKIWLPLISNLSSPTTEFAPYPTMSSIIISPTLVPVDGLKSYQLLQPLQVQNYLPSNNYYTVSSNADYFSEAQNNLNYYQELAYVQKHYGPTFPQAIPCGAFWNYPAFHASASYQELEWQDSKEASYSTDSASKLGEDDSNEINVTDFVVNNNSKSVEYHALTSNNYSHVIKQEPETVNSAVDENCSPLVCSQTIMPFHGLVREDNSVDSSSSIDTSVALDSPSFQTSDSKVKCVVSNSSQSNISFFNVSAGPKLPLFKGFAARTTQLHPKKLFLLKYDREQEEEERKPKVFEQPSSSFEAHKRVVRKASAKSVEPRRSRRSRKEPSRFSAK